MDAGLAASLRSGRSRAGGEPCAKLAMPQDSPGGRAWGLPEPRLSGPSRGPHQIGLHARPPPPRHRLESGTPSGSPFAPTCNLPLVTPEAEELIKAERLPPASPSSFRAGAAVPTPSPQQWPCGTHPRPQKQLRGTALGLRWEPCAWNRQSDLEALLCSPRGGPGPHGQGAAAGTGGPAARASGVPACDDGACPRRASVPRLPPAVARPERAASGSGIRDSAHIWGPHAVVGGGQPEQMRSTCHTHSPSAGCSHGVSRPSKERAQPGAEQQTPRGEGAGLRWAGTRGERVPLSLLSSYSKRKDGLERGQCLTPSSGQRACAWQAASSVRTRTAGSDPGLETLGGRNLGSTVFLVTSAFQESKVVSPLSAGVCKQNAHLPVAPQTHSSQLQVGGSACGFRGSP